MVRDLTYIIYFIQSRRNFYLKLIALWRELNITMKSVTGVRSGLVDSNHSGNVNWMERLEGRIG